MLALKLNIKNKQVNIDLHCFKQIRNQQDTLSPLQHLRHLSISIENYIKQMPL